MKKLIYTIAAVMLTAGSQAQTARVMAIHNSPDSALQTVDVWLSSNLGSIKIADDLSFRQSTGYIDAPAGIDIRLAFAPRTSTTISDTLIGFAYNLTANQTYLLMVQGTISPGYTPSRPFGIEVVTPIRERIIDSNQVYLTVFHGSNDAPEVEIVIRKNNDDVVTLPPLEYLENIVGAQLPTDNYFIDINDNNGDLLTTLSAPLATLGLNDSAVVVFASGFFNPANNANGPAFGVFAALANGTVVQLPVQNTFRMQVFHNCADSNARNVDIWLVNKSRNTVTKLLSNFGFRNATPFIDAPALDDIMIGVAPAGSTDTSEVIYFEDIGIIPGGITAFAAAVGVLDTAGFAPNPNGKNIDFQITGTVVLERSTEVGKVAINVFHGSTDAPRVDVKLASGTTLFAALAYGEGSETALEINPGNYVLNITPAGSNTVVAAFTAPLADFADSAVMVVASGFLNPAANKNGPAFGLFAVTPSGRVIALPAAPTSVVSASREASFVNVYPNPANKLVNISTSFEVKKITVFDMSGRVVLSSATTIGQNTTLDVSALNKGLYIVSVEGENGLLTRKLIIE